MIKGTRKRQKMYSRLNIDKSIVYVDIDHTKMPVRRNSKVRDGKYMEPFSVEKTQEEIRKAINNINILWIRKHILKNY